MNWLTRVADPLPVVLLWTTAPAFVVLGALLHWKLYSHGFSKAQESAERFVRGPPVAERAVPIAGAMPPARREFISRISGSSSGIPTQWSQLILLGVLLIVYVFNIKSLPLFSGERGAILPGEPGGFPQPGPRRIRARRGRGAVRLPGGVARGQTDVAATLEPARPFRVAVEQVLDGHRAAARSSPLPSRSPPTCCSRRRSS